MFYADLHLHSKYSRATSRNLDLEHMAIWARKKGVSVIATGDFTHPAWFAEIREKLVPAEPGMFRLRDDLQGEVDQQVEKACAGLTRFLLQVEISTIYKKGDRTRKVHHLLYVPDLKKAGLLIEKLSKIGNLKSDGRPILGLDSRNLLEITLECGEGCYLIPAHIWTPWFAVLGSKSGFDSVEECYGDLSDHIFALETGLSSDPPMNWRLSQLDDYALVSNSDAHSPPKIGREACVFDADMDYFSMRHALETGRGYEGTAEFFPEEGKYHLDGHRKCGIRMAPAETKQHDGLCPVCGKALTVGVMSRVAHLADRPEGVFPEPAPPFRSFVPLAEIISEIRGVGEKSKRVQQAYEQLLAKVGPELAILERVPVEDIHRAGAPLVAEAIQRMREGKVVREAGFDGEYGTIRLFQENELAAGARGALLFDNTEPGTAEREEKKPPRKQNDPTSPGTATQAPRKSMPASPDESTAEHQPQAMLDAEQRAAVERIHGPLLIVAGPGTGKTRTLTHRIAHLVQSGIVRAEGCLAITFSRRAAGEMAERLKRLLPVDGARVPVMTFHALGLTILREYARSALERARCDSRSETLTASEACGDRPADGAGRELPIPNLPPHFRVADDEERTRLLMDELDLSQRNAKRMLGSISVAKRSGEDIAEERNAAWETYHRRMREQGLLDFDDLITLPCQLMGSDPELAANYRRRWPWVSVDEFQDIDLGQYRLIQHLTTPAGNLCVIGDPDQSIYGFRGADPRAFERFRADFTDAETVYLTKNYRSSPAIVDAALQTIAPSSQVDERTLEAVSDHLELIEIHTCPTEKAEAEFVVHTIERLIGGSTFFSLDSGRVEADEGLSLSFGDFAVLYRTEQQAEDLIEALSRSGIPFQKRSHGGLTTIPTVRKLLEHLRESLEDENVPQRPVAERLSDFATSVLADETDLSDYLPTLLALAERYGANAHGFLSELALGTDLDIWDPRADRVSLLTLHAAKGLEFPVVFLVGCEDGLLPLRWGRRDDTDLDEERRLLFVGMTRAITRLIVSHACKRFWRGKIRDRRPSPFLQEIQEELLRREKRSFRKKKRSTDSQMQLFPS